MTTTITKPKKRHTLRWVVAALAIFVLMIIVIVAVSHSGSSPRSSTPASTGSVASHDDPLVDGGWTVSNIQVNDNAYGDMIIASVHNDKATERSGVFQLTVFSNGTRLGLYNGATTNVAGNQTVTVNFIGENQAQLPPVDQLTFAFQDEI